MPKRRKVHTQVASGSGVKKTRQVPKPEPPKQEEENKLSAVVRALECPVCNDTMTTSILQCKNGHSICEDCRKDLTLCPVCRASLQGIRNRLAEDLAEILLTDPCENSGSGCHLRLSPGPCLKRHRLICPMRPYKCLRCTVQVPCSELEVHYEVVHEAQAIEGPNFEIQNIGATATQNFLFNDLLRVKDEFLWFWWFFKGNLVYLGLEVCGQTLYRFSFKLNLTSSVTGNTVEFSGNAHSGGKHDGIEDFRACKNCVRVAKAFAKGGMIAQVTIKREGIVAE